MATWLWSLCRTDGVIRDVSSSAWGSRCSNISSFFKCWHAVRRSSMLLESICAHHYFPSVQSCDLWAAGQAAELVSRLERAELRQHGEEQGSGLAICADSRCLPVCSCISVGVTAALCAATGAPCPSVRLQPGQPRHCCTAPGFQNVGDLWEEGRTWASKVHLRGLSHTSLFPHITHPERITQQRYNIFCFVHFVLCAGYLCCTLSLVLSSTCVVPHDPPEERGKGNVSSSTETSTPLGLKGQPRNQLNLETIW